MQFDVSALEAAMQLPDRVALRLGNLELYWYGVLLAAAILVVIVFTGIEAKRKALPRDTAVDVCLVSIPCGVVGARLLYVLTNLSAFTGDFAGVFRVWDGGLSIAGAILFALLGLLLYARAKKQRYFRILDCIVPGLALAQGVVLWGDFFNQVGYGAVVTQESQMWFPFAVRIEETGLIHYAVFFYEFLWCLAIFALLFGLRKRQKRDGQALCLYLLLYCTGHIFFEALREDGVFLFGQVRLSQVVCCILIVSAAVFLLVRKKTQTDGAAMHIPSTESVASASDAGSDMPTEIGAAPESPDSEPAPTPDTGATDDHAPTDDEPTIDDER